MKIKFCGLFRECDIDYANVLKPDFVGFVFAENSKRFVDFSVAKKLKSRLDSTIKVVGVFVDSSIEVVVNALRKEIIDIVQLHGGEDNAYISALQNFIQNDCSKTPLIIKAIKMRSLHSLSKALESSADFILLDSVNAGSGRAFEWNLLAQKLQDSKDFKHNFTSRFFLAGGINADNIDKAIKLNPFCIDISSGIESSGVKDFKKMHQIIESIRTHNANFC